MKPEDIRKLLGGYATGTLTQSERDLLFAAALEDQALFDALADEESLRALLSDAEVRGHLLAVLDETDVSETEERQEPAALHVQTPMQVSAAAAPPMQAAAMRSSPSQAFPSRDGGSPAAGTWRNVLALLTPRRMALAGAVAAVILMIGAIVTIERNRSAAPVEVAENRQSQAAPGRDAAPAKQITERPNASSGQSSDQPPAKQLNGVTRNAPAEAVKKPSANAIAEAGRRDAPSPQAPVQIAAGTAASERRAPEPAASPSAARPNATGTDEQQRSAEGAADAVKDTSKASERKVEQKDDTATAPVNAVPPARSEPTPQSAAAPAPPPASARKTDESDRASKRPAIQTQEFAAGIMNRTRIAESASRLTATITDINGTIVSVNAGADAGLKNGDTLEIVRNGTVLGTVRLTDTHAAFAVGSLTRLQAAESPRAGDSLRRQTAPAAR